METKAPFHDNFNPPSRTRIESLRRSGGRAAAMHGLRCAVEVGLGVLVGGGQDFASAAGWCAGTPETRELLDEYHPQGTNQWSPDAPIALGWHPYNRCTLWRCHHCNAAFLRYTEYGGYYQDDRIRPLLAHLIVTPEQGRV